MFPEAVGRSVKIQDREPMSLALANDEEDTASQAFPGPLLKVTEAAEKSYRGPGTQETITIEGEDGEKEVGVGRRWRV